MIKLFILWNVHSNVLYEFHVWMKFFLSRCADFLFMKSTDVYAFFVVIFWYNKFNKHLSLSALLPLLVRISLFIFLLFAYSSSQFHASVHNFNSWSVLVVISLDFISLTMPHRSQPKYDDKWLDSTIPFCKW